MMPRITSDVLMEVRQMDLLTYLQLYEPGNLVHLRGDNYCTKEHDSLKISNGKWHWFSRGIGGRTALDYLVKVKEMTFRDAVQTILGKPLPEFTPIPYTPKQTERELIFPDVDADCSDVIRYLENRGIDREVIDYCIENKLLFQTKKFHNAMFVGYDEKGKPRYAALRGIKGSFKTEVTGSDKRYAFTLSWNPESTTVHVFEAAIDLMSYATLHLHDTGCLPEENLLSLAGVYIAKQSGTIPAALHKYLDQHPNIDTIRLHLDADEVGRGAAECIEKALQNKYTVYDEPPAPGKDVNEQLQLRMGLMKRKEEFER